MPQEPRSFFERLTGARVMHPSSSDDEREELLEHEVYDPEDVDNNDLENVMEESDYDLDDEYAAGETSDESEQEGQLTVDVFQDDETVIIQSTIAGVNPDDLDVSITNDMVTVRGQRRQQYTVDPEDYFYQECYWGTFSRSIILPIEIDADRAEAKIKNGVLTIRIPKANTAVTRKLKVKSN